MDTGNESYASQTSMSTSKYLDTANLNVHTYPACIDSQDYTNKESSSFQTVISLSSSERQLKEAGIDDELLQILEEKITNHSFDNVSSLIAQSTPTITLSSSERLLEEGDIDDELFQNLENIIANDSSGNMNNVHGLPTPNITLSSSERLLEKENFDGDLFQNLETVITNDSSDNMNEQSLPNITLSSSERLLEKGKFDDDLFQNLETVIANDSSDNMNEQPLPNITRLLEKGNIDDDLFQNLETVIASDSSDNMNSLNLQSIMNSTVNDETWCEYVSDEGFPYLYNETTHESKWKFSCDSNNDEVFLGTSTYVDESLFNNSMEITEWVGYTSSEGHPYYYNASSGISQWDTPHLANDVKFKDMRLYENNITTSPGREYVDPFGAEAVNNEVRDDDHDATFPVSELHQANNLVLVSVESDENQLSSRSTGGMRTVSLYSSAYERTKYGLFPTQIQSDFHSRQNGDYMRTSQEVPSYNDFNGDFLDRDCELLHATDYEDEVGVDTNAAIETEQSAPADESRYLVSSLVASNGVHHNSNNQNQSSLRYQEEHSGSSEASKHDGYLPPKESYRSHMENVADIKDSRFEEAVISSLTFDDQTAQLEITDSSSPYQLISQNIGVDSKNDRHLQIWSRFLQNASQAAVKAANVNNDYDYDIKQTSLVDCYPRPKGPPPNYRVGKNPSTKIKKTRTGSREIDNQSQSISSLKQQFIAPNLPWPVKLPKKQYFKLLKLVLPTNDESISEIDYQQNEEDDEETRNFKAELREMQNNALLAACHCSDVEVVGVLLLAGADANYQDENFRTPAHFSCLANDISSLEMLYNHSADLETTDRQQRSPLHTACQYGSVKCVSYLIQCGVNIDAFDIYGNTPLHYAASLCNMSIVKALIEYGASANSKNLSSQTPVSVAYLQQPSKADNLWFEMIAFLVTCENNKENDNAIKDTQKSQINGKFYSRSLIPESTSRTYSSRENEGESSSKLSLNPGKNTNGNVLESDKSDSESDRERESDESDQSKGSYDVNEKANNSHLSDAVSSDDDKKQMNTPADKTASNSFNSTVWSFASLMWTSSWNFFAFSSGVTSDSSDEDDDTNSKWNERKVPSEHWLANNRFSSAVSVKRSKAFPPSRNDHISHTEKPVNNHKVESDEQSWLNLKEAPPTAEELEKYGFLTQSSFLKKQSASYNASSQQSYADGSVLLLENERSTLITPRSALVTPRSQPPSDVVLAVAMAKKQHDSDIYNAADFVDGSCVLNQVPANGGRRANTGNISSDSSGDDLVLRHRGTRIRTPMGGRKKLHRNVSNRESNIDDSRKVTLTSSNTNTKSADVSERYHALSVPVKEDIREKQKNIYSLSSGVYPYGRYVDVLSSSSTLDR